MTHVPMTLPELMLAEHRMTDQSKVSFCRLDDGRIMQIIGGGGFVFSEDGGLSWSELQAEEHSDAQRNRFHCSSRDRNGDPVGGSGAALVKLSGKHSIGLAARRKTVDPDNPLLDSVYYFWRSDDNGQTWAPPVRMSPLGMPVHAIQDVLLRTSSGRLVHPVYLSFAQHAGPGNARPPFSGKLVRGQWVSTAGHFFDPSFTCIFVAYSDDEGRTWQYNRDGVLLIALDWNGPFGGCNEPSVTEVAPKQLLMVMRSSLGRLYQAWSHDNGETWTRPLPTSLCSTEAPAQIRTLPGGHLLCVWNQESAQEVRRGFNRTRLSAAVSRDGGRVWEFFQNVESLHERTRVEPGPIEFVRPAEYYVEAWQPAPVRREEDVLEAEVHGRWAYPSVLVSDDRVLISYSYRDYQNDPKYARMSGGKQSPGDFSRKVKVLPLHWFYRGQEPADNPFLKKPAEHPQF